MPWAEIARLGLYSQPLVEHLRRVTSNERRATSDARRTKSGTNPAPLRPCPPASPPHSSLVTQHASLIRLHPDIALAILRAKQAAAGRVWLLLRHADAAGRGAVAHDDAARLLTGDDSPLRVCGRRQLANLLAAGDGLFWERRAGVVWLRSAVRVAAALGVARLGGSPVGVPLAALTGSIGDVRAHLYASFHSGRQRADLLTGRPRPRGPIARATLTALSAAAPNSQRAYERRARVGRRAVVALGPPAGAADAHEAAWRRGRALFRLRDTQGRHGRPGAVYLAWQLPNEYTGPHATLPRGRQKRLNRALADLFHDGMTGNGERSVGSGSVGQCPVDSGSVGQSAGDLTGLPRPIRSGEQMAVGGQPSGRGPWSVVCRRRTGVRPAGARRYYASAKSALLARHDRERYWRGRDGTWYWQEELQTTNDERRTKSLK